MQKKIYLSDKVARRLRNICEPSDLQYFPTIQESSFQHSLNTTTIDTNLNYSYQKNSKPDQHRTKSTQTRFLKDLKTQLKTPRPPLVSFQQRTALSSRRRQILKNNSPCVGFYDTQDQYIKLKFFEPSYTTSKQQKPRLNNKNNSLDYADPDQVFKQQKKIQNIIFNDHSFEKSKNIMKRKQWPLPEKIKVPPQHFNIIKNQEPQTVGHTVNSYNKLVQTKQKIKNIYDSLRYFGEMHLN